MFNTSKIVLLIKNRRIFKCLLGAKIPFFCIFFAVVANLFSFSFSSRVPEIESVFLNMPNLHFLPCTPITSKFDNDVYIATSEPHGNIEATVTRSAATAPHCKL